MKTCISLKTKDGKIFYIEKKYLKQLKDFINNFKIEVSSAKVEAKEISTLEKIIEKFCSK
jgi:hypothetical protein